MDGQPSAAPIASLEEIIRDPNLRSDPHPTYHRLRTETPRLRLAVGDFLLTRWDDCEAVLRDPRFSSDPTHRITDLPFEALSPREQAAQMGDLKTLLFLDPPDHTRIRGLVSKAFTPRTVERLRPHITELCDQVLDEAAARGELDVVADMGYRIPVTVICELMGVPLEDRDRFGPWASDASRLLDGEVLGEVELNAGIVALMEFIQYFGDLFERRRSDPGDDLVSALLAVEDAGERLSESELRSIVLLLFIAGHETTMNLIGNGTSALLGHRDQLDRLRADPTLIGGAIEEMLRWDGPVHLTGRTATCDIAIGDPDGDGILVRQGSGAITLLAAANRDPARFEHPDAFDIARPDPRHLTFSHGIHYCLGAALARVEGQVAIERLVGRFERLELLETPVYRDHFILRGLQSLRVAVS